MPDATGAGLMASLRGLLCTGLALAENRLALLSNELEEQKLRLVYGLVMVVAGLFVLGVGLVLMCGFVLQLLWEGYRLPALAVLTLAFLGAGAWLLARARRCWRLTRRSRVPRRRAARHAARHHQPAGPGQPAEPEAHRGAVPGRRRRGWRRRRRA
jgi:uncharacterized membrane protein YqjE